MFTTRTLFTGKLTDLTDVLKLCSAFNQGKTIIIQGNQGFFCALKGNNKK